MIIPTFSADDLCSFLDEATLDQLTEDRGPDRLKSIHTHHTYTREMLRYEAGCLGSMVHAGFQIVLHEGSPVWMLTYTVQRVAPEHESPLAGYYDLLLEAMKQGQAHCPACGPSRFATWDYTYVNTYLGHIGHFAGRERVLFRGSQIYARGYRGGFIDRKR